MTNIFILKMTINILKDKNNKNMAKNSFLYFRLFVFKLLHLVHCLILESFMSGSVMWLVGFAYAYHSHSEKELTALKLAGAPTSKYGNRSGKKEWQHRSPKWTHTTGTKLHCHVAGTQQERWQ